MTYFDYAKKRKRYPFIQQLYLKLKKYSEFTNKRKLPLSLIVQTRQIMKKPFK